MTMAPLVAEGKVLVGNSGGEMGVRGWLTALDEGSGKIVWRAYSTGPDKDVLIGPDFHPPYADRPGQGPRRQHLAAGQLEDRRRHRLGLDQLRSRNSTDLLRHRQSGPVERRPAARRQQVDRRRLRARRRTPARRTGTTRARRTTCSTTTTSTRSSCSTCRSPAASASRCSLRPERNGYLLRAGPAHRARCCRPIPTATSTATRASTCKTGRIIPATGEEARRRAGSSAISARRRRARRTGTRPRSARVTGLVYIPHINLCMDMGVHNANYIAGTPFVGADVKMYAGPGGNRGVFTAWDPVARRKVWEINEDLPLWSAALATAGDVVFYGTMDGWFKAVDAPHRQAAVAVQDRERDHRPADQLSRSRRPSVCRGRRRASAAGPARSCRPTSTRATRPRRSGFVNATKDLQDAHDRGRNALCLRASALGCSPLALLRCSPAATARRAISRSGNRHAGDRRQPRHRLPRGNASPPLDPRAPPMRAMRRQSPRAAALRVDELRRLPRPRRRRHGPGADGRQVALRRPDRPDRRRPSPKAGRTACRRGAAKLTQEQIWQLAAYVRSLSGTSRSDAVRARTDAMSNTPPQTQFAPRGARVRRIPRQQ